MWGILCFVLYVILLFERSREKFYQTKRDGEQKTVERHKRVLEKDSEKICISLFEVVEKTPDTTTPVFMLHYT